MFKISKKDNINEYRVYLDGEIDGEVIYKGHRLGIPDELLLVVLDIKLEKSSNKKYFYDYVNNSWVVGRSNMVDLLNSWNSLLSVLGKSKIIIITKNNI